MLASCAGLAILLGCATASTMRTSVAPMRQELSDIRVEADDGTTLVSLLGVQDPVYTAFQQEEPPRVVVDLAGIGAGTAPDATGVHDGTVDEITVTPFSLGSGESRTRVELSLNGPVRYDVVAVDEGLQIRVRPSSDGFADASAPVAEEEMAETGETIEDPWASDPFDGGSASGLETAETAPENEELWTPPPPANAEPADSLLEVATTGQGSATEIHLLADGSIVAAEHFVLESPGRLVVDLPGMVSKTASAVVAVDSDQVRRIRIGQHADKVRVVIDGSGDDAVSFAGARVVPTFDGLVVRFDAEAALETAATPELPETWAFGDAPDEPTFAGYSDEAASAGYTDEAATETTAVFEEIQEPGAEPDPFVPTEPTAGLESAVEETAAELNESFESATEMAAAEVNEATEEAAAFVPEEPTVEMPVAEASPATTQVYGVQFDAQEQVERVVVLSDGVVRYSVMDLDPETFLVRMTGATIDPEAAVRIAPDPVSAVSLVTAFQQPEMDVPEVRVVVSRAAGVQPEVTQQGSMLFLDFPKGQATAAKVPVFNDVASEPVPASLPPSTSSAKAVAQAKAPAIPAALESLESVDLLEEGGLVDGKSYAGRRISLDFKDVEIADVLRLIAEVSDLNIIAGDEVQGKVTIRLVEVPWDQALDVILLTKGLGFIRVGNVLRIAPSDLLKTEEESRLQERRAKEKLEDLVVKLQPVNYADVDEVSKMVKRLLTARGTVDVDKRTNTVILKDIASVIDESTALIKAIDTQTPQVLIEAKIVEANLDFSREIGSTWAFGTQPLVDGFDSSSESRRDLDIGDTVFHDNSVLAPGIGDTLNHVGVANPITSLANGLLDLGAFILDEKFNVELRLEAAESNGEGKVISSPRVVTLDNRQASIEQGVSIPFQTFENGDAKLEFIDAVLKLDVTPHITADRSIIMQIEVQRNAPDDSVQTPTGSPAISKNQATTETLVQDGQTLVIGGIYVVQTADRASRVPYFHKIPFIGNAFKNHEVRDIRKELLVFVTPRIVVTPEVGS